MKTGKARYTPLFLSKADLDVALDNADGQRCDECCCKFCNPLTFRSLLTPILLQITRTSRLLYFVAPANHAVVLLPLQAGDGAGGQCGEGDSRTAGAGGCTPRGALASPCSDCMILPIC